MALSVTPFLMFHGAAAEAAETYAGLFPEGRFAVVQRDEAGAPMLLSVTIGGQDVILLESPVAHEFSFTPTFSFKVDCDSAAEVDALYAALVAGGSVLMELGSYPFSARYGWITDRFGVSWQIGVTSGE